MTVKFNLDVNIDELNLPPLENYNKAKKYIKYLKTGNFIKKYWGKLKNDISNEERALNIHMRKLNSSRSIGKKPVEVNYKDVTERENVFWFRPSECFANVIVPLFMLNRRQSNPNDRYQIIVNSYHAAIYDMKESIIYDPTIDVIDALGGNYSSEEKKIATLGLLLSNEAISIGPNQFGIGTLSLSEYLNKVKTKVDNVPLRVHFNNILNREAISATAIGADLVSSEKFHNSKS